MQKVEKTEWVWELIDKVKPNKANRNLHSKEQIERLSKILDYQGWRSPIIVSNLSGLIVCGHGRWAAAKKMGMKRVPVQYQDFESQEAEYAHMIADNAVASWATLDFSNIQADLPELDGFDIDLLGVKDFQFEPTFTNVVDPEPVKVAKNCPHCGKAI